MTIASAFFFKKIAEPHADVLRMDKKFYCTHFKFKVEVYVRPIFAGLSMSQCVDKKRKKIEHLNFIKPPHCLPPLYTGRESTNVCTWINLMPSSATRKSCTIEIFGFARSINDAWNSC